MPNTSENIAVTDLLGRPPGWLLRSGISLVFIIVIGGITLSAFIYYPDKIQASFVIQQSSPPISVHTQLTAELDTLLIKEGQTVMTGQLLGALAAPADWQQVIALDNLLQKNIEPLTGTFLTGNKLGRLQSVVASWQEAINASVFFKEHNRFTQEQATLSKEKAIYYELKKNTEQQIKLLAQQLNLEHNDIKRQSTLLKEGVISQQEYEQKEKAWLQVQQQLESLKANEIQHKLRINEIEKQQNLLKKNKQQQAFTLQQNIQQRAEELKGQIQNWKEQYLLIAPIAGQIVRQSDVAIKQQLTAGDLILTIIPNTKPSPKPFVRLKTSATGIGKVEIGDAVLLELDAYPSREYGTITTKIKQIQPLPLLAKEGTMVYEFTASISQPMISSYGKEIPSQELLTGTAFIITKNRSVLARIFEQLLDLVKNDGG